MAEEEKKEVQDKEVQEGKIYAVIGYLGILCIIPLLLKRDNKFALFHGKQGLVLFFGEVASVPMPVVLHIGDPFALDRMSDDHSWLPWSISRILGLLPNFDDLTLVVTIDLPHAPSKRTPSVGKGFIIHYFRGPAAYLQRVSVHKNENIIEFMMADCGGSFPIRTLCHLTVTHYNVNL